jgi:hypothetical protein
MQVVLAVFAALCACFSLYLNDVLTRSRRALSREGLLHQGFDYAESAGLLDPEATDRRLLRFAMLRMTANGLGLLFLAFSAFLLYRAIFAEIVIDAGFWASWGATTGAAALFFWTGR